jgi:glycosyltransferase involved in cell wall biosynthesis
MATLPSIILVNERYWPCYGGTEQHLYGVAQLLTPHAHISVITLGIADEGASPAAQMVLKPAAAPYQDPLGHPVIPLNLPWLRRLLLLPSLCWKIPLMRTLFAAPLHDALCALFVWGYTPRFTKAVQGAAAVFCTSTGFMAALSASVCKRQAIALMMHPAVHFGHWGDSPALLRAYAKADLLECSTEALAKQLRDHLPHPHPPMVICPPLPPARVSCTQPPAGVDTTMPFILFFGRRESYKGLSLLISAAEGLNEPITVVVAGPGAAINHPRCIDTGVVSEVQKQWLFEHCTIFCLPSTNETFGMVYVDAMACAKAVVALDVSPVNELIVNGESGLLVPAGSVEALRDALQTLLDDHGLRARLGAGALQRYKHHFSRETIGAALVDSIRTLLNPPSLTH